MVRGGLQRRGRQDLFGKSHIAGCEHDQARRLRSGRSRLQSRNLDQGQLTTAWLAGSCTRTPARATPKKAEGVGEIPETRARRQLVLPTVRAGSYPSLNFKAPGLAARDTVKLKFPVSPTPLPSIRAGVSNAIALRGSLLHVPRPLRRSHRHPWRSKTLRRRWPTSSSCAWSSSPSSWLLSSSSSFASSPCCPPS